MEEMIRQLVKDFGSFRQEVNGRFGNLESDVRELWDSVDETKGLTKQMKVTVEDNNKWIRAMLERQEVQNAESENLKYRVAIVEGVLQGVASSLEPVRKAR